MTKHICVYCSSSNAIAPEFFATATELGRLLAEQDWTLVYGGGKVGLMGALARSVHQHGGRVIGVIPEALRIKEVAYEAADELIITQTMQQRKAILADRADAFIGLPGGFGTLEEFFETLTAKQLGFHQKPIVLLNSENFFQPLLALFEHLYQGRFARPDNRFLYRVIAQADEVIDHLKANHISHIQPKWDSQ